MLSSENCNILEKVAQTNLSDIKKMIVSEALQVDSEVFQKWIELLGLQKEWQKARNLGELN